MNYTRDKFFDVFCFIKSTKDNLNQFNIWLVFLNNYIFTNYSLIVGGAGNEITSPYSCIIGGAVNLISGGQYSGVGFGKNNRISGSTYSTILGGYNNEIKVVNGVVIGHELVSNKYGDRTYITIIKTDDGYIEEKTGLSWYAIPENKRVHIEVCRYKK
jgi:hypothetical protein